MRKIYVFFLMVMLSSQSFAGWHALTHHSRANCINNESISWHKGNNYWFWVNSEHYNGYTGARIHYIVAGWQFTWRQAAVHWGEGTHPPGVGFWRVHGTHWMMNAYNQPYLAGEEWVDDCSIYDGWWD